MSSRSVWRSASVAETKSRPKRFTDSLSIQARPPRIAVWRHSRPRSFSLGSVMMKSMNSGTPASEALPDRSSFGRMRSTRVRTVCHSWGVKNFGL